MRNHLRLFTIAALVGAAVVPAAEAEDQWEHTIAMYLFAAGLDGQTAIGPVGADIDASFSDIVEQLEFGAMGAWRARKGSLAFTVDAMYVGLGADHTGQLGTQFDVDLDQIIVSADLAFGANKPFEFLVGARYMSLDTKIVVTTPGGAVAEDNLEDDWIDPYVGAATTLPINEAWSFTLRGDIGGFGVGSDLAWNAVARINWKFSEHAAAAFGYRILDVDYEKDLFVYDMAESGFVAGFIWDF